VDLLPVAEFAYNNTFQESIHQTLFFANYGYHPRFDSLNLSLAKNPVAQDLVTRLLEIHKDMKARLVEAQEWQKRNVDKSRKQNPNISVGDKIWLLHRNMKTRRPSDKLDYCRLGPFRVSKQVNEVAYRLDLPSSMKIHPVFHVSLLEPYRESTIPRRLPAPPPSID
jgi:molybdopterin converting factor small subunit